MTPEESAKMDEILLSNGVATSTPSTGGWYAQLQKNTPQAPETPSFGQRVSSDVSSAGEEVQKAISGEGQYSGESPVRRGFEATASAFNAIPKVASEALPEVARKGLGKVGEAAGGVVGWLGDKMGSRQAALDLVNKHPDAAKFLDELSGTLSASGQISGDILTADMTAKGLQKGVDIAKKVPEAGRKVLSSITPSPKNIDLTPIADNISPKLTSNEVKLALEQGRIVSGQDPTLLKGGTPDTILPSEKVVRATQTIAKNIPGAENMKAPELYTALDNKISEMGQGLRPAMEATPITEDTVSKITDDWEALKPKQIEQANATDEPNITKWQSQFEKYLQKSKSGHFGDLWDTRVAYDDSIPERVKSANSLSPENLQTQKEIWLQNRSILNSAINDTSSGLGEVSQKTFQEMNDMYNAQRGIRSSFKPTKEGVPSKIISAATSPTGKVIGGILGYETLKHTTPLGAVLP